MARKQKNDEKMKRRQGKILATPAEEKALGAEESALAAEETALAVEEEPQTDPEVHPG